MGIAHIASTKPGQYQHVKIDQGSSLDRTSLSEIEQLLQQCANTEKVVVELPSNCKMEHALYSSFVRIFQNLGTARLVFVSPDSLRGSSAWRAVMDADFAIASSLTDALQWASGVNFPGSVSSIALKNTMYLKCSGNIGECVQKLTELFHDGIKNNELQGDVTQKPFSVKFQNFVLWSFLQNALILDVANVFPLNKKNLQVLRSAFAEQRLSPTATGIYFVTTGNFQKWALQYGLEVPNINTLGNIIRITSEGNQHREVIWEEEMQYVAQTGRQFSPVAVLMTHVFASADEALKMANFFNPALILIDEISDANYLTEKLPPEQQQRMYHITPASDPRLNVLGPQLITRGYKPKLFAEYIVSRYRHYYGYPNDTYIYYFDSRPDYLHKIVPFFIMEFSHVLSEEQRNIIEALANCITSENHQGSFVISLLQDEILKLNISLFFPEQGSSELWRRYSELFPRHFHKLCATLLHFSEQKFAPPITQVLFHLMHGYNEVLLKDKNFSFEARLQEKRSILAIRSKFNQRFAGHYSSFFSLLRHSLFAKLPNKKILDQVDSLLWANYTPDLSSEDVVVTISGSEQKNKIKIVQGEDTRILLNETADKDRIKIQFVAEVVYSSKLQEQLLEFIDVFYPQPAHTLAQNSWQLACNEAISQVTGEQPGESLSIQFNFIEGKMWAAGFICDNDTGRPVSERLHKVLHNGVDKVNIEANGRQITLAKKIKPKSKAKRRRKIVKSPTETLRRVEGVKLPDGQIEQPIVQVEAKSDQEILEAILQEDSVEQQKPIMKTLRKEQEVEETVDVEDESEVSEPEPVLQDMKKISMEMKRMTGAMLLQEVEELKASETEVRSKRLQEAYDKALNAYNKKYGLDDEDDKGGSATSKRKTLEDASKVEVLRSSRCHEMRVDKVRRKIYTTACVLLFFCIGLLYFLFSQSGTPSGESIYRTEFTGSPSAIAKKPKQQRRKTPLLKPNPARFLVRSICEAINLGTPPTQDALNAMLKKLYLCDKKWREIGDIYNLTGRLYCYKIHIDRKNNLYATKYIKRWKRQARDAFARAQQSYTRNRIATAIKIILTSWKPETSLYDSSNKIIAYTSLMEAVQDMEKLQQQRILQY